MINTNSIPGAPHLGFPELACVMRMINKHDISNNQAEVQSWFKNDTKCCQTSGVWLRILFNATTLNDEFDSMITCKTHSLCPHSPLSLANPAADALKKTRKIDMVAPTAMFVTVVDADDYLYWVNDAIISGWLCGVLVALLGLIYVTSPIRRAMQSGQNNVGNSNWLHLPNIHSKRDLHYAFYGSLFGICAIFLIYGSMFSKGSQEGLRENIEAILIQRAQIIASSFQSRLNSAIASLAFIRYIC